MRPVTWKRMHILDLATLAPDSPHHGGKAAGLAALVRAGVPVPRGFAVEATDAAVDAWPAAARAELAGRLAALLAAGPIAVRSSAIGEDSAAHSFAGLFTSYLDVRTVADALAAVDGCIASARGARVLAYAVATGAATTAAPAPRVGVVCQRMVPARAAGVCFTADPTGADAAIVLEAVPGPGEGLVSGHLQPERWRVYRTAFDTWEAQRAGGAADRVLDESLVVEIAGTAAALARARGGALDLEWAVDPAGALWWLQARPVTALRAVRSVPVVRAAAGADEGPLTVWANWNVRETLPDPVPPMTWSLFRDLVPRIVAAIVDGRTGPDHDYSNAQVIDLVGGRPYWNLNAMVAAFDPGDLAREIGIFDADAGRMVLRLGARGLLSARRFPLAERIAGNLRTIGVLLRRAPLIARLLPRGAALARIGQTARDLAERAARPLTDLSDRQLLDGLGAESFHDLPAIYACAAVGLLGVKAFGAARDLLEGFPDARGRLDAGLADTPTTQISLELDDLIAAARPHGDGFAGHPEWQARLQSFLARFGQRCPLEFDVAAPRWADDPSMILALVRAGLAAPPGEPLRERLERLARERRAAIDDAARRSSWWRGPLIRLAAAAVERWLPLREAPKHAALHALHALRGRLAELGRRLAGRHLIDSPDDVFWLDLRELAAHVRDGAALPGRAELARRRAEVERLRREAAPDFVRSDGVPVPHEAPPAEPGTLRGTPVSAGGAAGRVRVLTTPDAAALQPGEVLVVRAADPGWTPLFPRAAALVMECGGQMCHAAVVARELGIPAVFGVRDATAILTDGQEIAVDGTAGVVRLGV